MDDLTKAKMAEEVRIMFKEFGWVRNHLANIYDMLRTESSPSLEDEVDPRQLSLFNAPTDEPRRK